MWHSCLQGTLLLSLDTYKDFFKKPWLSMFSATERVSFGLFLALIGLWSSFSNSSRFLLEYGCILGLPFQQKRSIGLIIYPFSKKINSKFCKFCVLCHAKCKFVCLVQGIFQNTVKIRHIFYLHFLAFSHKIIVCMHWKGT